MSKPTFKTFLAESPIGDYKTIGDWNKRGSFHSKRDRMIIQHPRAIEITKRKFKNNDHVFNLYFVNGKFQRGDEQENVEVGKVDLNWVRERLGAEVADAVEPNVGVEGTVNVIFTNNRGDEGKPMTAWIMAHRIAHAFGRRDNRSNGFHHQFQSYKECANTIAWHLNSIMDEYGVNDFPDNDDKISGRRAGHEGQNRRSVRQNQLMTTEFFRLVCTFKSARDNNIRDWFEVLHELFAQYVTTGKVKFKGAPKKFGSKQAFGNGTGEFYLRGSAEDVEGSLNSLANTLEYYFDEMLSDASSGILVM